MIQEKDLVWLPKELANKVKDLQSDKEIERTVLEYFNESKRELKLQLDSLDEDVIRYKANMMQARQKFREAKEEQLEANYQLWEDFEKDFKSTQQFVNRATDAIRPLKAEMEQLKNLMHQVDKWEIENLVKLIEKLNGSFYGETGNILKFLFANYTRPELNKEK